VTQNPFNGLVSVVVGLGSAAVGATMDDRPVQLGAPWRVAAGLAMLAFGLVYPHFVHADSVLTYLYAAPTGILPCPTLSVIVGFGLALDGLGSRVWSALLAATAASYGAIGAFRLGVSIDLMLLMGAIALASLSLGVPQRTHRAGFANGRRDPATRILDAGAGVGKFCVIGALTTAAVFVGVERWGEMVDIARRTAKRARVSRARFVHGRVEDMDWESFDGFYFYNPFEELAWPDLECPSPSVAGAAECERLVALTEQALARTKPGTRIATYHGFGGSIPSCFQLLVREPHGADFIECWEKR
jgi:hypothetical protein